MIRLEIGIGEAPVDCEVIAPRYNGDMPPRSPESVVTFGHVVRTARIRIRWTQREPSRRSGVPQSKISLIERGLVDDVRLSEIETL